MEQMVYKDLKVVLVKKVLQVLQVELVFKVE